MSKVKTIKSIHQEFKEKYVRVHSADEGTNSYIPLDPILVMEFYDKAMHDLVDSVPTIKYKDSDSGRDVIVKKAKHEKDVLNWQKVVKG
jgi:hypothetical protein